MTDKHTFDFAQLEADHALVVTLGSRVDGLSAGFTLLNSRFDALTPPEPNPPTDRSGVWIPTNATNAEQQVVADANDVIRVEGFYRKLRLRGHSGQRIVTGPDGAQLDGAFERDYAIVEADGMVIEGAPGAYIEAFSYNGSKQRGAFNGIDAKGVVHRYLKSHHNHWLGFRAGPRAEYYFCEALYNGTLGFGGSADHTLLEDVLIKGNREVRLGAPRTLVGGALVSPSWEAGGLKLVVGSGLVLRRVRAVMNYGPGLWCDIDVVKPLITECVTEWNARVGIKLEIGEGGWVLDNTSRFNGWSKDAWLWGAQIQAQDTSNVEIARNIVEVAGPQQAREIAFALGIPVSELSARRNPENGFGDGIAIVDQNRVWRGKTYNALNTYVHDNRITYNARVGQSGEVDDDVDKASLARGAQRWEHNTYVGAEGARWAHGGNLTWSQWVARYPTEMREAA